MLLKYGCVKSSSWAALLMLPHREIVWIYRICCKVMMKSSAKIFL